MRRTVVITAVPPTRDATPPSIAPEYPGRPRRRLGTDRGRSQLEVDPDSAHGSQGGYIAALGAEIDDEIWALAWAIDGGGSVDPVIDDLLDSMWESRQGGDGGNTQ